MKAGFFETDITPAYGMEKPGGYGKAYNKAMHDPLKARAAVFDNGERRLAFVGIDTCVVTGRTVREAREAIAQGCGIEMDAVMIGASHTHAGGPLFGLFPDDVADASSLVRTLVLEHSTVVDPLYHAWVVGQIATAVCEADRRKEDARISVGSGYEAGAVFNRRFKMKDGKCATHPGKMNPDIVAPAGPVDPEVGVVAAWRPDGPLLGCIINYACHGTTGPGGTSADWIHYLERILRGAMGRDTVTVFLNGACGDVTQVNNLSLRTPEFGEYRAREVGARVGAEAVKVLVGSPSGEVRSLAKAREVLRISRRRPSPESIVKCRQLVEDGLESGETGTTEWTFAKERLVLDYLVRKQPEVPVEVQALQVGPALFLANPSEFFCRLGLDIKDGSAFPFTFVVELANGGVGYVPTPEALDPMTGGGYETVLTSYSNLAPDAGPRIVQASLELAARLTPEPPPQEELTEPSPNVWGYGWLGELE
ncbi:MAG: hypothetical protein GXP31_13500 [Kiritimatiellaeota bacterium]|nr:hypothetical protein [Kiritimatiellota bacterium]